MPRFLGMNVWTPSQVPDSWNKLVFAPPLERRLVIHSDQGIWFFEWDDIPQVKIHQTKSGILVVVGSANLRSDFQSESFDCAAQVACLLEQGHPLQAILANIEGEFALLYWDSSAGEIFFATDAIGRQVLYYMTKPGGVIWASHPQQLASLTTTPQIDKTALNLYFSLKGIPAPWSLIAGVHKVRPGCVLRLSRSGLQEYEYWRLSEKVRKPYIGDLESAQSELIESLREIIRCYLKGVSYPAGIFLSGGLDSTCIAAIALKEGVPLQAFSVGYSPSWRGDESKYAVLAAHELGIPIEVVQFSSCYLIELMQEVVGELPEPIADPAFLPQLLLARYAAGAVTVMLDGTGADAVFGGSNKYLVEHYRQIYARIPYLLRKVIAGVSSILPSSRRWLVTDWLRKWQLFIKGAELPEEERSLLWSQFLPRSQITRLLSPEWLDNAYPGEKYLQEYYQRIEIDKVSATSLITLKGIQPWVELRKLSAIEQNTGISICTPFLSPALVEFGLRLPESYKVQNAQGKVVLRKACKDLVPPVVLQRRKANFVPPVSRWIGCELREVFWETMLQETGLFNLKTVQRMMREHIWGWRDWSSELWSIFVLQYWWIHQKGSKPNGTSRL